MTKSMTVEKMPYKLLYIIQFLANKKLVLLDIKILITIYNVVYDWPRIFFTARLFCLGYKLYIYIYTHFN